MLKQIFEIFKSDSLYEQALGECHEMLDIDLTMYKESIKSLKAAMKFIKAFKLFDPKYGGTGKQRALLIEKCMEHGPNYYKRN